MREDLEMDGMGWVCYLGYFVLRTLCGYCLSTNSCFVAADWLERRVRVVYMILEVLPWTVLDGGYLADGVTDALFFGTR